MWIIIIMLMLLLSLFFGLLLDILPTISPVARYTDSDGNEQEETSVSEGAPLVVTFLSGASDTEGWTSHYEWHFYLEGSRDAPYLVRYEEETEVTFTTAGSHRAELWATFTLDGDTVSYTDDYWQDEGSPLSIVISESKLEMPNAFSPNDDGINDVYKAKDGYQSIVKFKATIFNRWGQKMYSWDDPSGGWDGKHNGKDVAQGVYFVLVEAEGADGRKYRIRRDVNLLRGYTESDGSTE